MYLKRPWVLPFAKSQLRLQLTLLSCVFNAVLDRNSSRMLFVIGVALLLTWLHKVAMLVAELAAVPFQF